MYVYSSQHVRNLTDPHSPITHTAMHSPIKHIATHITMPMCNWLLPRFLDNYAQERNSDVREYYARLRCEKEFHVDETNALHNDLKLLGAPLVDRVSLRKPRHNVNKCRHAVYQIHKENNLMLLR